MTVIHTELVFEKLAWWTQTSNLDALRTVTLFNFFSDVLYNEEFADSMCWLETDPPTVDFYTTLQLHFGYISIRVGFQYRERITITICNSVGTRLQMTHLPTINERYIKRRRHLVDFIINCKRKNEKLHQSVLKR